MELILNEKFMGFTVTRIRPIPESGAQLIEMVYDATQTPLCWVKNGDSNKLFSIAFKTLPEDSTGVFHILEHSVLSGSEKYPLKEPFVELLKGSMNTFLNAMTFPDKTLYPVSSRNETDFLNLASVYLDAVFAPRLLTDPNIFYQEGWHYEEAEDGLIYNGVVFNEMKGATASVDHVCSQGISELLFPDTSYRHNSGGEPAVIPDLTYEQYVDSYKKCYHPSNAYIFLDGDISIEDTLQLLNTYLSRFSAGSRQAIALQKAVSNEGCAYYESTEENIPSAHLVMGKIIGSYADKTRLLAAQVLCDVLAGNNDAPLTRAILDSGLCRDVSLEIYDGIAQPFSMLHFKNLEDSDCDKLKRIVFDVITGLNQDGINREDLEAAISRIAFRLKQMQEPQGLIRAINALECWLYGGDPMDNLHFEDAIAQMRQLAATGGFEQLLLELFGEDDTMCTLHVLSDSEHGAKCREKERNRLKAVYEEMAPDALQQIRENHANLLKWQQSTDDPETMALLPRLDPSEISSEPLNIPTEVTETVGVTVLRHAAATNGITYLTLYFNLSDYSEDELTKIAALSKYFGKLSTKQQDASSLQRQIRAHLGNLSFRCTVQSKRNQTETATPCFVVSCSVLSENYPKAVSLIQEVLFETLFDQTDRIREIAVQDALAAVQQASSSGHTLAMTAVNSHNSAAGAAAEQISGITKIRWIQHFAKNMDEELPGFQALAERLVKNTFCRSRLTVSVTEQEPTDMETLLREIPEGTGIASAREYRSGLPKKLGIQLPAQVSFTSIGGHLGKLQMQYKGSARIASKLLSLSYLWGAIRVQGGAYGAGMRIASSGNICTYSFRDPSPANSIAVCTRLSDALQEALQSGESISKFIVSSIAETEPLMSPSAMGSVGDERYFAGVTQEDVHRERQEILSTTYEDLKQWVDALKVLQEPAVCVVGYPEALKSCEQENITIWEV